MPLHPFIVHLPVGLALVMPLLLFVFIIRGKLRRQSQGRSGWLLVMILQAVILAGALFSNRTGDDDSQRVVPAVSASLVEAHEDAAHILTVVSAVLMLVAATAAFHFKFREMLIWVSLGLSCLQWGQVMHTAKLGTELVYRYGAAGVAPRAVPSAVPAVKSAP
jgi:uncharacterized membrane protein